ncbi:MAG: S1/P1 nuclease [Bryobacteraceae bacterium]
MKFTAIVMAAFTACPAMAWGPEGHRIVARIAAANLSTRARMQVASLLLCDSDPSSVAEAMANVSNWADTIDKRSTNTGSWHYIDIALTDTRADVAKRCPNHACISEKIPALLFSLRSEHVGDWSVGDQLKFIIHLVGDLHEPLHCADNADRGGNCVQTRSFHSKNLHQAWDFGMLEEMNSSDVALASDLMQHLNPAWKRGSVDDWTWESHEVAVKNVYGPLGSVIPKEPPEILTSCEEAPAAIQDLTLHLSQRYLHLNEPVIREQLAKAGLRLATLLNALWS